MYLHMMWKLIFKCVIENTNVVSVWVCVYANDLFIYFQKCFPTGRRSRGKQFLTFIYLFIYLIASDTNCGSVVKKKKKEKNPPENTRDKLDCEVVAVRNLSASTVNIYGL